MNETIVIDTDCIKNEDIKSTLRDIINDMNDSIILSGMHCCEDVK